LSRTQHPQRSGTVWHNKARKRWEVKATIRAPEPIGPALLRWRIGCRPVRARVIRRRCSIPVSFAGYRFPPDLILVAVRWYLRYGLSYRDVEELLAERGIDVDHVTIYRWVQRFTPLVIDAARPCRHSVGDRWFVE
jgi:hypothetical protein